MYAVKIADMKNNLSRHLARVRRGAEVTVLDRNTPVARLVPFVPADQDSARSSRGDVRQAASADTIAALVRDGIVSGGSAHAVADWAAARKPLRRPAGAPSAVELLLEMRREQRR